MKLYGFQYVFLFCVCMGTLSSCKKYLAAKPDQSLALPQTLNDLNLLLENYALLNNGYPAMGEISADNFYLTDAGWGSSAATDQHYYLWQAYDNNAADYVNANKVVTTANLILESLGGVNLNSVGEVAQANNIKGSALFFRAFAYWVLAQNFCTGYHKESASTDLGLPIRLGSDVTGKYMRSSVEQTYRQIIKDASQAILLLPDTADVKYHVGKAAVFGLLSRTYLCMQDYDKAGSYADSSLQIYSFLMDYNADPAINAGSTTAPFAKWNREVVFDALSRTATSLARTRAIVDTSLFSTYQEDDLRKKLFFQLNTSKTGYCFKGNYTGLTTAVMFYGIATDEMLLTRAECEARVGNVVRARSDLNTLLSTRWQKGYFIPYGISNRDSLLNTILLERRKELVFRGLRWTDLRRLNEEDDTQVTLVRKNGGTVYTLTPNSERYVFLFPYQSINLSGMQQNP